MREQQLYAKLSKCEFWIEEIAFLEHIISKEGVKPDLSKIKAIIEWEAPRSVMKIRSFLGLVRY